MYKKRVFGYITIVLSYILLIFLDANVLDSESKLIDFLAQNYPSSVVQSYVESQKKWWWLGYAMAPIIIGIKILLVSFCINFIKIIDMDNAEKIKFSNIMYIVILAEFVFVIAEFYKFFNFYLIDTDYTLEDLQTYYPMSLLNIREHISMEKWITYLLQVANLFELFYWGILVWGVRKLFNNKISYIRSLGYVAMTYGVGLVFWIAITCFIIINAQY